jgi:hypothetical protein
MGQMVSFQEKLKWHCNAVKNEQVSNSYLCKPVLDLAPGKIGRANSCPDELAKRLKIKRNKIWITG